LFSPRSHDALPGLEMNGPAVGYPTKVQMADYLASYAEHFRLPVRRATEVTSLRRKPHGFELETRQGDLLCATAVVVATGAFQQSKVPPFAAGVAADVAQFTAQTYARPSQLPPGPALVVGGGGTGRQIAWELASVRSVWLSTGRSPMITPARIFGRDLMWWIDRAGALRADRESLVGRLLRRRDAFPGLYLRDAGLRRRGVRVVGRTVGTDGHRLHFADGACGAFASIVWAIGYEDDASWVRIPEAVDATGAFVHERGASPVPGLYFVGRSWQTCRASALVCGVGDDAARTVMAVRHHCSEARSPSMNDDTSA
jgi:putative flavoprotein involved in K+ transport